MSFLISLFKILKLFLRQTEFTFLKSVSLRRCLMFLKSTDFTLNSIKKEDNWSISPSFVYQQTNRKPCTFTQCKDLLHEAPPFMCSINQPENRKAIVFLSCHEQVGQFMWLREYKTERIRVLSLWLLLGVNSYLPSSVRKNGCWNTWLRKPA